MKEDETGMVLPPSKTRANTSRTEVIGAEQVLDTRRYRIGEPDQSPTAGRSSIPGRKAWPLQAGPGSRAKQPMPGVLDMEHFDAIFVPVD